MAEHACRCANTQSVTVFTSAFSKGSVVPLHTNAFSNLSTLRGLTHTYQYKNRVPFFKAYGHYTFQLGDILFLRHLFYFILFYFILPHTNNITKLINKRKKEEERMMTIVARRLIKRNYKAYVYKASSIIMLQLEKEIESMATAFRL